MWYTDESNIILYVLEFRCCQNVRKDYRLQYPYFTGNIRYPWL